MTHLKTDRLIIRWPRPEDAQAIYDGINDFDVVSKLAKAPWPYLREYADYFVEDCQKREAAKDGFNGAIELDGQVIGMVGLSSQLNADAATDTGGISFELGYWLAKPFWGKGIMSEAARAMRDYAFYGLDADVLVAGALHGNEASWAILMKLGFAQLPDEVLHVTALGKDVATWRCAISRQEWDAAR